MIYVFSDGRMIYGKENLAPYETGYVEVETLPPIPPKDGMTGYFYAKDGELAIGYFETPPEEDLLPDEPAPIHTPPPEPTNTEIMQAINDIQIDLLIAGVIKDV